MEMIRKAGFTIFLLAALAAGTWAYFQLKKSKVPVREAASLLPAGAALYAECADFSELRRNVLSRSMAVDRLRGIAAVQALCTGLRDLDSLSRESECLRKQLGGTTLHFALYEKNEWLLCFSLASISDGDELLSELSPLLHTRVVDGIINFMWKPGGSRLYAVVEDGIVVVSATPDLLGKAMTGGSRLAFTSAYLTFKEQLPVPKPLLVYVDHARYAAAGYNEQVDITGLPCSGITCGEFETGTADLTLNGFMQERPQVDSLAIRTEGHFTTADLVHALPEGCTTFRAWSVDSLRENSTGRDVTPFWQKAADSALFDVRRLFYKNIRKCLAVFSTSGGEEVMLAFAGDTVQAREHIQFMADSVLDGPVRIYGFTKPVKLLYPWHQHPLGWVALSGDRLYFSQSPDRLAACVSAVESGATMAQQPGFTGYWEEHIMEQFRQLCYFNPIHTKDAVISGGNAAEGSSLFSHFRHFSWSTAGKGLLRVRMHLMLGGEERTEENKVQPLWTLDLDAAPATRPQLFPNHVSGENEMILQDEANNLYLISAKGQIIWKRPLPDRMLSPAFTVDAFRNKKYQMLFNTENEIFLIDRNGRDVEGFPVKLKAGATSPLSVFDYENNRNYRIVVPCSNKTIYNYGIDGKGQSTWTSPRTGALVKLPLQYMNVRGTEFLVAMDVEGKLYLLNRRGQVRQKLKNLAVANCKTFYADRGLGLGDSYIIYPDEKNSLLCRISLNDQKSISKLGEDIDGSVCFFSNADDNRFRDLVVKIADRVMILDLSGNPVFDPRTMRQLQLAVNGTIPRGTDAQEIIKIMSQAYLNAVDRPVSLDSEVFQVPIDLFKDGTFYLVSANGRQLWCRRLN